MQEDDNGLFRGAFINAFWVSLAPQSPFAARLGAGGVLIGVQLIQLGVAESGNLFCHFSARNNGFIYSNFIFQDLAWVAGEHKSGDVERGWHMNWFSTGLTHIHHHCPGINIKVDFEITEKEMIVSRDTNVL
ncbi:hypothetical protein CDAR_128271 [Caerostris darwini]|uniref:Uncharacterized protein n=1 Tax=Caerostris darwini TaxID=1538125 RepID=A0AAV4RS96_9ARAC|nr:hypothetical protein CDAR_128231 [Caerostris darwini]GIY24277.1 hypothetical protein CDAR_128271 [Caerostris darwini]